MKALLIALLLLLALSLAGHGDFEDAVRHEAFRQSMISAGHWPK